MEFLISTLNVFLIVSFVLFFITSCILIINNETLNTVYIIILNILMFIFNAVLNYKIENIFPDTIKVDNIKYEKIDKNIIYSKYQVINQSDTVYFDNIQVKQE